MQGLASAARVTILFSIALFSSASMAEALDAPRYKAVAFDYFVIFNPDSVVPAVDKVFPGRGAEFTKVWRAKQFE